MPVAMVRAVNVVLGAVAKPVMSSSAAPMLVSSMLGRGLARPRIDDYLGLGALSEL